jgi:hypothetical protein
VFRRIVEDYESHLMAVAPERTGAAAAAKAEHERFSSGDERFKIRLRKLSLADDTQLDVYLMDQEIGSTTVQRGRAELIIESTTGAVVPRVKAGDRIVVAHEGVALFGGIFQPD